MDAFQLRFLSAGLFFLWIVPSGLWLKHSGKPYGVLLFNLHKLIGLGVLVFLAINVYRLSQSAPLSAAELIACVVAGLFFVATIISGGLVSIDTTMPAFLRMTHKILPYVTVLLTIASLYVLLRNR